VISCEEDRLLRPVLVGMLREAERVSWRIHRRTGARSGTGIPRALVVLLIAALT
jgi:hypothetical protein